LGLNTVDIIRFSTYRDSRGALTAIEGDEQVPFELARVFYMYDVPATVDRGGHAHKYTQQILIAVHGTITIVCSDGEYDRTVELKDPSEGLLLPKLTWTRLAHFSPGAVCLVLADTKYNMSHSIRSWGEFLEYLEVDIRDEP